MNCGACNAELKVGATQCLECGKPVEAAAVAAPPRDRMFGDWVNLAVRIIKMEEPAIHEAARDPNATMMAAAFIGIAAVAPVIGTLGVAIFLLPVSLVFSVLIIGAVNLCATLLGGKGDFQGLIRVQGLSHMLGWVQAVPILGSFLGFFAMLYSIVVWVNNVSKVHKLPIPHAVAAVLLPAFVLVGVMMAVVFAFVGGIAALGAVSHHR